MMEDVGVSIRQYTDDDFAAVCALNGEGQTVSYDGAVFVRQAGALYGSTFLCAVCDGVVCGYSIGAPVTGGGVAWVIRLGVLPSRRGLGIGRALMKALEERFEALGIWELSLSVHPENKHARSLYESLGYMVTETVCGYFGEGEDRLIMKKVLNSAKSSSLSPCR
ncbi:GNAT family N-acetyltransferase [Methanogenium marinum]|uniref:GNAT family N-acetyltransferase n=1 Tax=Methanogenium marinum TaxID=348610 RepID=A0A9Q4KSD8_9EURY|nr:N-acetyltransferase [Methanogenium marinum]MDE4907877.1 GNAT family N-acetyltransferase [Methanogenium marinum]